MLEVLRIPEQCVPVGRGELGVGVGQRLKWVGWFAKETAGRGAVQGGETLEFLTVHFALSPFDLGDGGAWDAGVVGDVLLAEPELGSAAAKVFAEFRLLGGRALSCLLPVDHAEPRVSGAADVSVASAWLWASSSVMSGFAPQVQQHWQEL